MSDPSAFVHRLPPEILARIFRDLHSAEGQSRNALDDSNDKAFRKRAMVPYSVSSVCRYWDEVSTLVPELWDCPRLVVSLHSDDGGSPAQMIQKHLHRAPHNEPFHVHVVYRKGQASEEDRANERRAMIALLPILSSQIHRLSQLFITTLFATSLPPYPALFPPAHLPLKLGQLFITTMEPSGLDITSLPPWPIPPSLQFVPSIGNLGLSGATFISYCRIRLQHLSEPCPSMSLTARNLSRDGPEAFTFEEFFELLEQISPTLANLTLLDVDLAPSPTVLAASQYKIPEPHPFPTELQSLTLVRVDMEVIVGLLMLAHRRFMMVREMLLFQFACPAPIPIIAASAPIHTLAFLSSIDVASAVNALYAIDPRHLIIMDSSSIGDGVEFFHKLKTTRNWNRDPLLGKTVDIRIENHGYICLDSICQFVETRIGRDALGNPLSCLRKLHIQPTPSIRWAAPRVERTGTSVMAWIVGERHFHLCASESYAPTKSRVRVEFTHFTV
ncbi:hypothetical protein BKA70DRAFT_1336488 [Coprinopsis sp. MPI-PUGE-AT-0042]|nr:hypothetical protein BKA70DRAFT_1336488 [Coprinopsis sp. MPI-PUGE-AT-0042]